MVTKIQYYRVIMWIDIQKDKIIVVLAIRHFKINKLEQENDVNPEYCHK